MVKREATGLMLAQLTVKPLCLMNGGWDSFRRMKSMNGKLTQRNSKGSYNVK
jgi:hypothetical protein